MRKMFCFDVDNTIFNHRNYEISERTLEAIETLGQEGHLIVLATGRDLFDTHSINIVEVVKPDAIVHANGLKVTIGSEVYFEHLFDKNLLKQILDFSKENGLIIGSSIDDIHYFTNPETLPQIGSEKVFGAHTSFSSYEKLMEQPVYSLNFYGQESELEMLKNNFPEINYFMFAFYDGADVLDIAVSKADGIEKLLGYYAMSWENVVCFGDSSNDISMLKKAGLGIAMGNAIDSVKSCADYVTKNIDEDGVAYAIENL
ncbi:MAG: Cof-like hydrolase [Clostridiales bacterium]|jgi:Cof subfamily protein (haloacid dehalogenase superfamily)|nr:Cof-like hydrolase [Clostridiales bacterium]